MTEDAVDEIMNLGGGQNNPIELKDASAEVKQANHYIGEYNLIYAGGILSIKYSDLNGTTIKVGDILYNKTHLSPNTTYNKPSKQQGYYKVLKVTNMGSTTGLDGSYGEMEYLGESYLV